MLGERRKVAYLYLVFGCFILCNLFFFGTNTIANAAELFFAESNIWDKTEDGLVRHFVFGLAVTNDDTVLAFCEGRISSADDGAHHILLKRSIDGGVTWGDDIMIAQSTNGECYANPTPVVDKNSGKIILFYAQNFGNDSSQVFYKTSTDNGLTWSNPIEVTSLFNNDPYARPFHLPGPGHGIQLSDGRLVLQIWHRFSTSYSTTARQYGTSVIYSDDAGNTWLSGGYASVGYYMNESRIIQLNNGDILINARDATGGTNQRVLAKSFDRGISWGAPYYDSSMPVYTRVDSGMLKYDSGNVLFSRPNNPSNRVDMTISVSEDECNSWSYNKLIHSGTSTYSDLAMLSDKTILCIYEQSDKVVCARMNLEYLKASTTPTPTPTPDPTGITYECESLGIASSSGDTQDIYSDDGASGGAVLKYMSNAIGDYVSQTVNVAEAGTYHVKVRHRVATNRAQVQLKIDGANQGETVDPYSASIDYQEYDLGYVTFGSSGNKTFEFEVIGKNTSSTGYAMFPDCIILSPVQIKYECESLSVTDSSGDSLSTYSDTEASGGKVLKYMSDAVGDYVSQTVDIAEAGTYHLKVRHRVATNRAQVQLKIDGADQGGVVDPYSTTIGYQEYDLGYITFSSLGSKTFMFEVVGKHANSSGYAMFPDSITLIAE